MLEIRVDRAPIVAGEEFAVAIATPPQAADKSADSEFVVAIDASVSMMWPAREGHEGPTRWHLARHGALALIAAFDPMVKVHVLMFDGRTREIASGTAGALRTSLARLLPMDLVEDWPGTNIEEALTASYRLLEASTAVSRRVVLLSDGEPTTGNLDEDHLAALAARAGGRDIYTDPVGLGAEAKVDLLLRLSGTGSCHHVASRSEADRILGDVMRQLAVDGQLVAARGGHLRIEVSPHFAVGGVYQINPAKRICTDAVARDAEGVSAISVQLGPIGPGEDGRVMFALKLRAPQATTSEPVELLRATADIRRHGGAAQISGPTPMVKLDRERSTSPDSGIFRQIRMVEFEAEIAERLRYAPPDKHEQLYHEAEDEARGAGLRELADQYRDALAGFGAGLGPADVFNEVRAASSRSTTRPSDVLLARPELPPSSRQRHAPPRARQDDWFDEDDIAPRAGGRSGDDHTRPGDPW